MQQAVKAVKSKKTRPSVTTVADYIGAQLAHLPPGVSQKDVAEAIGYSKPNILVMIKSGDTKLPINKAPALAKALGIDPLHLTRMALNEYMPEIHDALQSVMGSAVSANELELLKLWRESTLETDPQIVLDEDRQALRAVGASVSKIERDALTHAHDDMRLSQKKGKPTVRKLDS